MWQLWVSETLQKRLSNASVTLQKRPTNGLHVLLDVFIHFGRFHGQRARRCGALLARVRVCMVALRACDRYIMTPPGFTHGFTPLFLFSRDPAARGTIKTPGLKSLLEISTGVTDFCKFIVSIGAGLPLIRVLFFKDRQKMALLA
jgi:hypothetical protein